MESLYNKYENIKKFISSYRKYTTKEKFYDYDTFKKIMQVEQYIKHICYNPVKERFVYVYVFAEHSKYIKTTSQFKRIIDKIPEELIDVIIISKLELNVYISKALLKYQHLNIYNYLYKYFAIELTNGPLCSKHTILSNDEVRILCSRDLIIHPLSLPSISINDPQNIWVGGELGHVIKIESISEITGKTERYRIVSPDSGKLMNTQKIRQTIPTNDVLIESIKQTKTKQTANDKTAVDDNDDDDDELKAEYVEETDGEDGEDVEDDES